LNKTFVSALEAVLAPEEVLTSDGAREARRFDQWAVKHLRDWGGASPPAPGVVVRPTSVAAVQSAVRISAAHRVPLIPFGLGSGVVGGVQPDTGSALLDLGGLNAVRFINETDLVAGFDAGLNGLEAEEAVAAKGLTIGHWPQSIAISSVGGWVSTRASGQFSTAYGNIEDIVFSLEVVLPNGELLIAGKAPRAAAGPDLRQLFLGGEGTMGVVTGVVLSLRPQAERRALSAYSAPSLEAGFEAQRRIVQADWRPPVMRFYDARETRRMFRDQDEGRPLLIMVHEGPEGRVEAELAAIAEIAAREGLTPAPTAATAQWLERRNHTPAWRDLFERGLVGDTIEVSAPWSRIAEVYRRSVAALETLPGLVNASAHSSHVYRTGLNLYFSFALKRDSAEEMERAYFDAWRVVMEATAAAGGGVAHHHGAGRLRKPYLEHDLGETGVALLRTLKGALDPHHVLNPGNLIPDV